MISCVEFGFGFVFVRESDRVQAKHFAAKAKHSLLSSNVYIDMIREMPTLCQLLKNSFNIMVFNYKAYKLDA